MPPGQAVAYHVTVSGKEVQVLVNPSQPGSSGAQVGVVLTHGASGDAESGNLPRCAQALSDAGIPCVRFTCKPTHMPTRVKAYTAVLQQAASGSWPETQGVKAWVCAGHSMGARATVEVGHAAWLQRHAPPPTAITAAPTHDRGGDAGAGAGGGGAKSKRGKAGKGRSGAAAQPSETAADTVLPEVAGCVLLSYPLHPPGRTDELRDTPLCDLKLPLLFVRGTRDTFSEQPQWEACLPRIRASSSDVQVHEVQGGDHSLNVPKSAGGAGKKAGKQAAAGAAGAAGSSSMQSPQEAAIQGVCDAIIAFVKRCAASHIPGGVAAPTVAAAAAPAPAAAAAAAAGGGAGAGAGGTSAEPKRKQQQRAPGKAKQQQKQRKQAAADDDDDHDGDHDGDHEDDGKGSLDDDEEEAAAGPGSDSDHDDHEHEDTGGKGKGGSGRKKGKQGNQPAGKRTGSGGTTAKKRTAAAEKEAVAAAITAKPAAAKRRRGA